jgi:hypothetical protein
MTVPIAMVTGIEIRTQSRTVRRMVKDRALQISPIQLIWRPLRTVLGERIRFDGARLGGNAPDL